MRLSYEKALARLNDGDRIIVTNPDPFRAGETTAYGLMGGGVISVVTFRKLTPLLKPSSDGLFEDCPAQTFEIA